MPGELASTAPNLLQIASEALSILASAPSGSSAQYANLENSAIASHSQMTQVILIEL